MIKQARSYLRFRQIGQQILILVLLTLFATLLSFLIKQLGFNEVNIVILYILSVLLASRYTRGFIYGIFTSFIATLSFNFFFTEPVYTFTVYDKSYIFTFIILLLASLFSSTLTSNLINAKEKANAQEKHAQKLYGITSSLAKTRGINEVITVSLRCLSGLFNCEVICILTAEKSEILETRSLKESEEDLIFGELRQEQLNTFIAQYYSTPITIQDKCVCIFCLQNAQATISRENLYLLESIYMQISIAMEREYLAKEKETAKIETVQEKFKNNLLRAISHDLRTPLAVITGASEMLLHSLDKPEDISVAAEIYEDSIWLTRMVENILSLTRIQDGRLNLVTQLEAVEEIIAESIRRVQKYTPTHKISIVIPDDVIFIHMDSKLIVQVLINLLDNAVKHTGPDGEIKVKVTLEIDKVWFEVSDNGTGIAQNDLSRLFDVFYLSDNQRTDAKRGIGLGLAICKAIVNMHGGDIYAENNKTGGARFSFFLNR
jgi:two-component system, OmpR family, sensor histidine kinase KdpD